MLKEIFQVQNAGSKVIIVFRSWPMKRLRTSNLLTRILWQEAATR